ncbi:MAG: CcdB family protein [Pseudomonadota bacterium]
MARFDVFQFRASGVPLVLDAQASLLSSLTSRVVVPLVPAPLATREQFPRLKPTLMINGEAFTLITTDLSVVPVRDLGPLVENIEARHGDDILAALDFLFSGF